MKLLYKAIAILPAIILLVIFNLLITSTISISIMIELIVNGYNKNMSLMLGIIAAIISYAFINFNRSIYLYVLSTSTKKYFPIVYLIYIFLNVILSIFVADNICTQLINQGHGTTFSFFISVISGIIIYLYILLNFKIKDYVNNFGNTKNDEQQI